MSPLIAGLLIWDKKYKGELPESEAISLIETINCYSYFTNEYSDSKNTYQRDVEYAHQRMIYENFSAYNGTPKQSKLLENLKDFIKTVSIQNSWGETIYLEDLLGLDKFCPFELAEIEGKQELVYDYEVYASSYGYVDFSITECDNSIVIKFNKDNIDYLKMLLNYLKNIKDESINVFSAYCETWRYKHKFSKLTEVREYLTKLLAKLEAEGQTTILAEQGGTTKTN